MMMHDSMPRVLRPASVFTRDEFRRLTLVSDKTASGHLLTRFFLNIFLIYLMLVLSATGFQIGLIIIWFIYATQFHFWGYAGIGHEFLHRRVFSSKLMNDVFYQVCSSLTWNNAAMFRGTHMLHHNQTFSEQDVEAHSVKNWSIFNVFEYSFIDIRTFVRRIFYVTINALGFYPNFRPLSVNYVRSARVTFGFNIILYASLYFISLDLLFTFLMAVAPFSCSLLNKILAKAQHHDLICFKDAGSLRYSRTLVLPQFLSFLYANMNYHAEHHFAPSVPYYNLPKMHKLLETKGLISSQSFCSFFNEEFQTVWLKS